jgi:hypothetical protein
MDPRRSLAILLTILAVAAAGCGGDTETSARTTTGSPAGAVLPGGGLSIEEAKATDAEPPLAVTGFLVRTGDESRLCTSLRGSAPPRCGEPSLRLRGDADGQPGERVTVFGAVEDGVLVLDPTVNG